MSYLKFISDDDLVPAVGQVVGVIKDAERDVDLKFHKNVIDPFSALFDGVTHAITYEEWIKQEKTRQIQKTMQNAIGNFHQKILGAIPGWVDLGIGGGLDVLSREKKIIAEVKNKYNTTKGNHLMELYDAIKSKLDTKEYAGYTGYYVEIISKGGKRYNKPYTPSDNKTKNRRPVNPKIRVIDGVSFYALATGRNYALRELFEVLPTILIDDFKCKLSEQEALKYFSLLEMAFSTA